MNCRRATQQSTAKKQNTSSSSCFLSFEPTITLPTKTDTPKNTPSHSLHTMSSTTIDNTDKEDQNQLLDALQSSTGKLKVDLGKKVRLVSVLVDNKQAIVAKVAVISRTTGETLQESIPEKKGFSRKQKHKDVGLVIFVAAKAFAAYKAAKIDLVVET